MVLWPLIPLLFEINDQVDRIQAAFILKSASALEGTQHNRHKVMRQQNRESPRLTGRNLCRVFHNILFPLLQLLELIAKSQLPALSGVAQKNYMNILERVVQKGELRQSFSLKVTQQLCFRVYFCERTFFPHCSTHGGSSLVHFAHLILLYFVIVREIEHIREAEMKLCCSPVCTDN